MLRVALKMLYLRERVTAKDVHLVYVPTKYQRADLLTKTLARPQFEYLRNLLLDPTTVSPAPLHERDCCWGGVSTVPWRSQAPYYNYRLTASVSYKTLCFLSSLSTLSILLSSGGICLWLAMANQNPSLTSSLMIGHGQPWKLVTFISRQILWSFNVNNTILFLA